MSMANPLNLTSNSFLFIFALIILYVAYTFPKPQVQVQVQPRETNLLFYVHDYFTGEHTTAVTVAGVKGHTSNILHFGTMAIVDDPITEGPSRDSTFIGRAQGVYVNSQLDGQAVFMVFSAVFTAGEYKGSTLEIQGYDLYSAKEREFGVVSGTGYFRFVKGYGFIETEFMDLVTLRAILKLNVTVKHY